MVWSALIPPVCSSSDRVIEITDHSRLCIFSDDLSQYYLEVSAMETRKRPKETRKRSNKGNGRDDWAGKGNCMLYSHLENVSIGSSFLVEQSVNCFAVTTYVPEKVYERKN